MATYTLGGNLLVRVSDWAGGNAITLDSTATAGLDFGTPKHVSFGGGAIGNQNEITTFDNALGTVWAVAYEAAADGTIKILNRHTGAAGEGFGFYRLGIAESAAGLTQLAGLMATELPTLGLQMMGAFPAPVQIAQGGAGFDISALFPPGAALAMTGFGPNVLPVGDFSGGIGYWTVSGTDGTHSVTFAGATMRYQSGATSPVLNLQSPAAVLEIGKTYRVTTNTSAFTSGSLKIDHSGGSTVVANAAGSKSGNIVANSTVLTMLRNSANVDLTLNAISVQKVVASLPALVSLSGGTLVAASGAGASAENTYAVQVTYLGQTKAYTFNMAVS